MDEQVGGHVALDLVNTVDWRLDPARVIDRAADVASLVAWGAAAGAWEPPPEPSPATGDVVTGTVAGDTTDDGAAVDGTGAAGDASAAIGVLSAAHAVREATYVLLTADPGSAAAVDALAVVHAAHVSALRRARVDGPPLRWHVPVATVADIPAALALHAVDLLRSDDVRRVRQCADDACGWLFLDATRNRSRRWCSSADCGNRARARRHYARRKAMTSD